MVGFNYYGRIELLLWSYLVIMVGLNYYGRLPLSWSLALPISPSFSGKHA